MFEISAYGDRCLRIQLGEKITPEINQKLRSFSMYLSNENIPGIIEWIPTYTAISIIYNPYDISFEQLKEKVILMKDKYSAINIPAAKVIHIPTCYEEEFAPDLHTVAKYNGLDETEVVSIHSSKEYLIYMIGFSPGFPYLGGMSNKIATPRLAIPRQRIPAGSVGIAEKQTGIYSVATPGGWQLIGRTPVPLYDSTNDSPILLKAGNYIKFIPISTIEYRQIEKDVKAGTYKPHIVDQ